MSSALSAVGSSADIASQMSTLAAQARSASRLLADSPSTARDQALKEAAAALRRQSTAILAANARDMEGGRAKGLSAAMLDRLELNASRIEGMARGLEDIAALPDPLHRKLAEWDRPNGLRIARVSVPLGVIGIIYEARPNVTADAGGLCLKSGNAAILRGGSESFHSSRAIAECIAEGLKAAGLPEHAVQLVPTTDREAVGVMLGMIGEIDVIIPRGGKSLTERIQNESRVPTLQHLDGNCHTYIHASADTDMAREVLLNAKMRRTGICGATESLVIDVAAAERMLPALTDALTAAGCALRGDARARALDARITPASDEDWDTEYLAPVLSVKVVDGVEEAIEHVNRHSSHHTEAIVATDAKAAEAFLNRVDSAIVMHNASTQFADGGEFGMGAEIGIATGRLHARGPVGAEQLTIYKYVVKGSGQVRPG